MKIKEKNDRMAANICVITFGLPLFTISAVAAATLNIGW